MGQWTNPIRTSHGTVVLHIATSDVWAHAHHNDQVEMGVLISGDPKDEAVAVDEARRIWREGFQVPRIRRYKGGGWSCGHREVKIGFGSTPWSAYRSWSEA